MPTSATGALGKPGQGRESAGEHDTSGGDDAWWSTGRVSAGSLPAEAGS